VPAKPGKAGKLPLSLPLSLSLSASLSLSPPQQYTLVINDGLRRSRKIICRPKFREQGGRREGLINARASRARWKLLSTEILFRASRRAGAGDAIGFILHLGPHL